MKREVIMSSETINNKEIYENKSNDKRINILIYASKEVYQKAVELQSSLNNWANADIWDEVFGMTSITLINYYEKLSEYHLSIFILTKDDMSRLCNSEAHPEKNVLFFRIVTSFAYLGRKSTIIAMEIIDNEQLYFLYCLQATSIFNYNHSKPINELVAHIEWHCNENKERWGTNLSDLSATTAMKENNLRRILARTKMVFEVTKFNEFIEPEHNVSGEIVRKYCFPTKYGDGAEQEFLLVKRNGDILLTDQGRTYVSLDKIFELNEPDVQKNLMAILKQFNIGGAEDSSELIIKISSWNDNPNENENDELKEAIFKLYAAISFMDNMKIFYV